MSNPPSSRCAGDLVKDWLTVERRGMAALMGRDVNKLKSGGKGKWKYMSEKDMLEISEKFKPYRSVFMWYMWRVEDVDVTVMEKA